MLCKLREFAGIWGYLQIQLSMQKCTCTFTQKVQSTIYKEKYLHKSEMAADQSARRVKGTKTTTEKRQLKRGNGKLGNGKIGQRKNAS